jgi:hypothetical protein
MSKKLILALVGVVFLSSFNLARAEVIINEIKYSPSTKQWVEIYNDGGDIVDLTQYKILDAGAAINGHGISLCSNSLSSHSYAVIAKTPEDFSGSTFVVCKSPLGIKSTADDTVVLKIGSDSVDTVLVAEGSATNGNSLQLINGSWSGSNPTPGIANQISSGSNNDEEESDTAISNDDNGNSSSSVTAKTPPKLQKPKVQIISKKIAHVGVPFLLEGTGTGTEGEKLSRGRYYWNFGDGDFREKKVTNTEKFTHTYFYPGEYTILFEHYPDSFTDVPDATAEIAIEVIEPKILISKVGDTNDFFIEMTNETGHDADISNWVLLSNYKVFTFPKNTNMSSNRKMIISPRISGFNIEDKSTLKLMTAEREVVFDYSSPTARQGLAVKNKSLPRPNLSESSVVSALENLPALALGNNVPKQEMGDSKSSLITPLISFVFIGASAYAVYFIRRKKFVTEQGEDFEILDE